MTNFTSFCDGGFSCHHLEPLLPNLDLVSWSHPITNVEPTITNKTWIGDFRLHWCVCSYALRANLRVLFHRFWSFFSGTELKKSMFANFLENWFWVFKSYPKSMYSNLGYMTIRQIVTFLFFNLSSNFTLYKTIIFVSYVCSRLICK